MNNLVENFQFNNLIRPPTVLKFDTNNKQQVQQTAQYFFYNWQQRYSTMLRWRGEGGGMNKRNKVNITYIFLKIWLLYKALYCKSPRI